MNAFVIHIGQALLAAGAMAWQVGRSLVLGFVLSGIIQAVVSKDRLREQLGRSGVREIALAISTVPQVQAVRTLRRR